MTNVKTLIEDWKKDPEFVREYEALEEEFSLASALISARARADMTQEQVAEKMRTSQSYIAKLESGRVSPSMKALQRYAAATGTRLKISLEQQS
ncbi:MAG: helix-turn-helix transcriptional regulator [Nitratireductor sp.]|nr:helix-turn-helix transcriptional regulator [Nitratireductor sp.]